MATAAARKALRQAERRMLESMSDAELLAIIDGEPPDPEFESALTLLTDAELEWFIDSPNATRQQVIDLAASRRATP